jgi:hypothetical protein
METILNMLVFPFYMKQKTNSLYLAIIIFLIIVILTVTSCNPGTTNGQNQSNISIEKNTTIPESSPPKSNQSEALPPVEEESPETQPSAPEKTSEFVGIKFFNIKEDVTSLACHYSKKLIKNNPVIINDSKINLKLELTGLDETDYQYAEIRINDNKTIKVSLDEVVEIGFANDATILLMVGLIRNDYAMGCVNTNENYDITFCENKSGSDRFMCFDNLGYLNGIEYCQNIPNPEDRTICVGGASGTNG